MIATLGRVAHADGDDAEREEADLAGMVTVPPNGRTHRRLDRDDGQ
jgi:hypothetical protein